MPNIFDDIAEAIDAEAEDLGQIDLTVKPDGGTNFTWNAGKFSDTDEGLWQGADQKGESKLELIRFKGTASVYHAGAGDREPRVLFDKITYNGEDWTVQAYTVSAAGTFYTISVARDSQVSLAPQPGGTAARK